MSWNASLEAMNAAVFPAVGEPGAWSGAPIDPVWIIVHEPELAVAFGQSRTTTRQRILEVQRSEVPGPAEDDQVAVGVRRFVVIAKPELSDDGSVWICEARELA